VTWEERLARAYESKLFKEFALVSITIVNSYSFKIDLKHYKSKRLALRWRTGPEVIEGIGEETCGSLRCKNHSMAGPMLRAFELPFVYEEGTERATALVKVRLCERCQNKLTWKPKKQPDVLIEEAEGTTGVGRNAREQGSRRSLSPGRRHA
jgi:protein FRA10AC1